MQNVANILIISLPIDGQVGLKLWKTLIIIKAGPIAWYHPETQGTSGRPKMPQDYSGCLGITQHLSGWLKITWLVAQLDDLCINHWLFVLISVSCQQRDKVQ